jgi:hypothetical protein
MVEIKNSYVPLAVGSVVDKVTKDRVTVCPFFKPVGIRFGVPFGLCSLCSYCPYHGKRVRLKFHFSGFEVVWICPKVDGFPNEEM